MSGTFGDPEVHATMVLDRVRVDAFARAIAAVVKPGQVVVDVGAGTGLLALLAARAGARKVYAIERGPMIEVLARTIEENGASGVVEPLFGDAREVGFAEPPDVIVSETLGSLGIDEDCLGLLMAVRSRCAPGCAIVPSSVEVVLAPIDHAGLSAKQAELAALDDVHGLRLGLLRQRVLSQPLRARVAPAELLGSEVVAAFTVGVSGNPASVAGTSAVARDGVCNAVGGWFRSELAPGVPLSNAPGAPVTCWSNFVLPLDAPLEVKAGQKLKLALKPRVVGNPGTWAWTVGAGAGRRGGDAMGLRR